VVLADRPVGLSGDAYDEEVRNLDCALFLYRQDYRLTASGAIFDVIGAGVQVLSLPNSYLRDVSESDTEGGIRFFDSLASIEAEIRAALGRGHRFPRYSHDGVRRKHSVEAGAGLLSWLDS